MDILNELLEARCSRLSRRIITLELQLQVTTDLCDSLKARCAEQDALIDELLGGIEPPVIDLDDVADAALAKSNWRMN